MFVVEDRSPPCGYGPERARRCRRGHLSDTPESFAHALDPERRIRVQKDVFGAIIGKVIENNVTEFPPKFYF